MDDHSQPRLKALIVEDEVDICYLLKGILRFAGVDAHHVTNLHDAEQALQKSAPPLVFLDNHLPDGFGVNFIRPIKTRYPATKVVMVTAHDTPTDRTKAFSEGVDMFIGKPFTRDIIVKAVKQMTEE